MQETQDKKNSKDRKEAYHPKKIENRTYTLCERQFQLYSLEGYTFDGALDVGISGKGLYCFTKKINPIRWSINGGFSDIHDLIYLGKTSGFEDRPYEHNKFSEFKGSDTLGIYQCLDNEDPKEIESTILASFFFCKNCYENQEIENRRTTVMED